MNQKLYAFIVLFFALAMGATAQTVITDADLTNGTYTWTADQEYLLDGYVFLEEGGVLNIEPGTVIRGKAEPSTTESASALIITRGAKIYAEGTLDNPIVFTAEDDDLSDPSDLLVEDRGLWGGLIVMGKASITDNTTEVKIEGVATSNPDDPRLFYGAPSADQFDDEDNSGVLRYVSVRHGGSKLDDGDEINGITLGAVGSGTTIEYVEVIANDDDGIEWFGGTVNVKNAVVAFCKDDAMDWDTGFKGKGQFWFVIYADDKGGNGGEHDGAKPDDASPGSNPVVFNATYIGAGQDNSGSGQDDDHALLFRDNSAGTYANSIFTDFAGYALQIEDISSSETAQDSYKQMQDGELQLLNNIWFGFGEGDEWNGGVNGAINITEGADDAEATDLINHLTNTNNTVDVDPQINSISRTDDGGLDPRPADGSPAFDELAGYPTDDFFVPVMFKGAFPAGSAWVKGWTAVDEYGFLDESLEYGEPTAATDLTVSAKGFVLGQNFPNPAVTTTNIEFTMPTTAEMNLDIYAVDGQKVMTVFSNTTFVEGQNNVEVNVSSLQAGMYYYTLSNNDVQLTKALFVR